MGKRTKLKNLPYSDKNWEYVKSLKPVYLLGYWYDYGIREYPFTGEFEKDEQLGYVPIVYDFTDHNGTYEEYVPRKITEVTTGEVIIYCFSKPLLESYMNKLKNFDSQVKSATDEIRQLYNKLNGDK